MRTRNRGYQSRHWVVPKTIRSIWYQFWHDYHTLPPKARSLWLGTLALGFGITSN